MRDSKPALLSSPPLFTPPPSPPPHSSNPILNLIKKPPILDLKRLPHPRRILHRILNQPALPAQLQIDILLRVLAADVRHVDGDQDVGALLLQPDQVQHDGGEVGRGDGRGARWRLGVGEGRRLRGY
jgi:hypothetical protein